MREHKIYVYDSVGKQEYCYSEDGKKIKMIRTYLSKEEWYIDNEDYIAYIESYTMESDVTADSYEEIIKLLPAELLL